MQKLNTELFEEIVYDEGEPCVVVFSRQSCHVCQEVKPMLEEIVKEYQGKVSLYYVDVEEDKGLFQKFSLKGVPQVLFFKDGELLAKLAGKKEDEEYKEKIDEMIG